MDRRTFFKRCIGIREPKPLPRPSPWTFTTTNTTYTYMVGDVVINGTLYVDDIKALDKRPLISVQPASIIPPVSPNYPFFPGKILVNEPIVEEYKLRVGNKVEMPNG